MSIAAMEAVDRLPGNTFATAGLRYVLYKLADLADEEHSCNPEIEWLMERTSQGYSTVQRHLVALCEGKWLERERLKNEDGTLGGYRYWLSLEKLRLQKHHRSNRAVDTAAARPVENSDPSTGQIGVSTARFEAATGQIGATTGQIDRSLKEELLPSFPSSFIFSDEQERELFVRVFQVVGPGMADRFANPSVLASLRRVLPRWVHGYDFELDVLPMIQAQTARVRKPNKLLTGFDVLEPDLRTWHRARIGPPAGSAPRVPVIGDQERLERLRADELRVSLGKHPIFSTSGGETLDEAAVRIKAEIDTVQQRIDDARKAAKASA